MTVRIALVVMLMTMIPAAQFAAANEHYHEKSFNADTRDKFAAVSANVIKEMQHGGRYEFVKPDEREQITAKLAEIGTMFEQNGSVGAMDEKTKIALFNDQEVVNSILTRRDRDRVICTHQAPVGSHIPITTCHTYAQEVEAREGTLKQMDAWRQPPCFSAPTATTKTPPCYMGPQP